MTQEELDLLKVKAKDYGHYAKFLKMEELISEVEKLSGIINDINSILIAAKKSSD